MVEVNIGSIDTNIVPRVAGIYVIENGNKAYVGKSSDIFKRLNFHRNTISIKDGAKYYIIEAYKDISELDLMIMEDFYILKYRALGYDLINTADAIPPKLRRFLIGRSKKFKVYNQFKNGKMKSKLFKFDIRFNEYGKEVAFIKEGGKNER